MRHLFGTIIILIIYFIKNGDNFSLYEEVKKRLLTVNAPFIAKELLMTVFESAEEHDAKFLNKTMKDFDDNKDILHEILVTRSNKQLTAIKNTYKKLFDHELAKEIEAKTKDNKDYKALLLDLLEADRDESKNATDPAMATKDAELLYKAGEKRWGTDEEVFAKILANQNVPQLRLLFDAYENLTSHSIEKSLNSEFSGDELDALLDIVSFVRKGPVGVLSKIVQKAIKGDSNDELLVHLIYSYKKLNFMDMIQNEVKSGFKGPLAQAVKDRAKTEFLKNALINLVTGG